MTSPFIASLYLVLGITCPQTVINNVSSELWGTEKDLRILKRCKYVCGTRYAPENPCLKWISKRTTHSYWAICGVPDDNE